MHDVCLLVEAHAFNWQQILGLEVLERGGFSEDIIDNLVLNHLEVDHSSHKGERRLVLFVKGLDFEEGSEWVLFFTLVVLLVEGELVRAGENAVWKAERLSAVVSVRDRAQVLAKSRNVLLRVRKISDTGCVTNHVVGVGTWSVMLIWGVVSELLLIAWNQ